MMTLNLLKLSGFKFGTKKGLTSLAKAIIKILWPKKLFCFYFLPLLSAGLMVISYMPFPPGALFFCYVPLWWFALQQKKLKPLLIGGWICQFMATLIGFHWLAYTFREFGFLPWSASIVGLLLFAGFANLQIPIALFLWFISQKGILFCTQWLFFNKSFLKGKGYPDTTHQSTIHQKPPLVLLLSLILLPLYFAFGMEYYPMIFKWHFGYSWFYAKWPAAQTAEIWGFQFLNTLTLFFNLLCLFFYIFWRQRQQQKSIFPVSKKLVFIAGGGVLFFTLLNIWGIYLKNRWPKPNKHTTVLMVQPNIENLGWAYRKQKTDPRPKAYAKLVKVTDSHFAKGLKLPAVKPPSAKTHIAKTGGASKPDFILWPEGTYPYRIGHNTKTAKAPLIAHKAIQWQTPILLSATGESHKGITNSLFSFNKEGKLIQPPYDKSLLLAFGEYLPGDKWIPWGKWLPYYNRAFNRGNGEHKILQLKQGLNLGFQICYEGLFDFFTRDLAKQGADVLVNVTNDSWYGRGLQPYQHLYMTLPRAIEVRRPLIRGTNTGFSVVVSAKGDILTKWPLDTQASKLVRVPYNSHPRQSVWTLWGYYINRIFLWTLWLTCLGVCLAILICTKRGKPKAPLSGGN